jgi:hypothetical protein
MSHKGEWNDEGGAIIEAIQWIEASAYGGWTRLE